MTHKRVIAALCAALLLSCAAADAEEKRIGDLIYVPAMTVQAESGTHTLRVTGLTLDAQSDDPVESEAIAGAEFGVYVVSSSGELTPWANPLYPSEPMRIRTGEGETRFSLPQGTEFYLRQESAPEGYLYDSGALIPVTDGEIVVRNAMAGQLLLTAQDSLGQPLEGVTFTVISEDWKTQTAVSDASGQAVLVLESAGVYRVEENALPEGVYEAIRTTTGRETDVVSQTAHGVSVQVSEARRTRVTFEHPAAGTVQLSMKLAAIGDDGQTSESPLAGVRMDIQSDNTVMTIVTDETGTAQTSLLEGQYTVRLSFEGDAVLPVSEGLMIVESGSTTVIELTAAEPFGRVMLSAEASREVLGASMTLTGEATGEVFGPYALDGANEAISAALAPGAYAVTVTSPQDMLLGALTCGEDAAQDGSLRVQVTAGQITQVAAELLTLETQRFALTCASVGEDGSTVIELLDAPQTLTLIGETGETVGTVRTEDGHVTVEALTGEYRLRMDEASAEALGVQAVSEPFTLPDAQESIVFSGIRGRMILTGVDENGTPAGGAVYEVTDAAGNSFDITTDENGLAVTPLMEAGEATVRTVTAPQGHDAAVGQTVFVEAGKAAYAEIVHERFGTAAISVRMQELDERGETALTALGGARVLVSRIDGEEAASLTAGEDGLVSACLESGEYVAQIDMDSVSGAGRAGDAVRFEMANGQSTQVSLTCYGAERGVRIALVGGTLSDEELAQVRFELVAQDGTVMRPSRGQEGFYQGALSEGEYTLLQTQMPQGYTLGEARTVTVSGGVVTDVSVPLEEYAVLSVAKTGLTFNDSMQTYVVPLTGEYGVYTMVDGAMQPYPSEEAQMTVWSNVTPEQIARGRASSLRLPAAVDGTTYYLRELSAAQGFALDETYHEVTLVAGGEATVSCTVSSDRGFFTLEQLDAVTGTHVTGGAYELLDAGTRETVLTFEMGDGAYTNTMAVAVGSYLLRQTQAAPGYALSEEPECAITVEPYLTQGGAVTEAFMSCARLPEGGEMDVIDELYAAQEQGLTLVCASGRALEVGQTLVLPRFTVGVSAADGTRLDVRSVQIDGVSDGMGTAYMARVEYCLADGGWQPSDARMTQVLEGPAAVSLSDVADDVCAVRITYIDAQTGEEIARSGFVPGRVTLDVRTDVEGPVELTADASFTGSYAYALSYQGERQVMARESRAQIAFEAQGSGRFATVPAGRDGRISGFVFFDHDANGLMGAAESGRYAGMTVTLVSATGDEVESCRTDAQGRYSFDTLSAGTYTVRFDAPDTVAFSRGALSSEQVMSGIEDTRYGESASLVIDGDHTDYVVNAGCIYAAQVGGTLLEREGNGTLEGFGSLSVELRALSAGGEDEPFVVLTDETGSFRLTGVLPGDYELTIALPEGYLCADAEDGRIVRSVTLEQSGACDVGTFVLERGASVSGFVRVDDDGDGAIAEGAQALSDVTVKLLRISDGHSELAAQTQTDAQGAYRFDMLASGDYSVLFELEGDWAFTRYGEDSLVYGAAAASGSTESFALTPGLALERVNAGVTIPAQLTVSVFRDTQFDGQKGVYEEMLGGVSVTLIRIEGGEDAQRMTCMTGGDGLAVFDSVSPGEYVLEYQMPDAWRATKQVDPQTTSYPVSCVPQSTLSTGRSEPFTLAMGEKDAKLYIGAMLSGSISGEVYYDDDADAVHDEGEAAVGAALVELLSSGGEVLDAQTTDDSGAYAFEGLAPGRYTVRFTAQEGCGFSATERSMVRSGVQESDSNVSSTRTITVTSGSAVTTASAGVVRLASLTGTIWVDSDADGAMDDGEAMLAGVEVALMNGSGRNILTTTQTGTDGSYAFESVRPGSYMIRVSAPDGYVFSGALTTSPLPVDSERDGRVYTSAFTLLGGARVEGVGFGLYTQGGASGRIWLDKDYDGLMGDAEDGLRGAVLTLIAEDGTQAAQTTSQKTGEFSFSRLVPGVYSLRVELPEGYVYTREGGDSAAAHSLDGSQTIHLGTIAMGQTVEGVNIGALQPSSVSGTVWLDTDDDGRRQPSDDGAAGARVTLIPLDGGDSVTASVGESGTYRFENVMPGRYALRFELTDGQAFSKQIEGTRRVSCVPMADAVTAQSEAFSVTFGVNVTDMDVGVVGVAEIEGAVWTDSVYDGQHGPGEEGVYGAMVELIDALDGRTVAGAQTDADGRYSIGFVRTGTYTVRVTLPDSMIFTREGDSAIAARDDSEGETAAFTLAMGEGKDALEFGAIAPAAIRGTLYVDGDENGALNAGEAGLDGAVITLMQGGTIVETCSTDANGAFAFETVRPGTYRVRVTLPEDTLFALGTPLTLADPDAAEGETPAFEMGMGQQAQLEPLGTVRAACISGRAWTDENADGRMGSTEAALPGTMVELLALDAHGASQVVDSMAVGEDGAYAFGMLRSGTYALRVTLPEGMLFADFLDSPDSSAVPVVPGNAGMTAGMALAMGEQRDSVNIGGIRPGEIGDSVWFDRNGNGLQDYREPLIAGVELILWRVERDGSTQEVARTVSDAYGYYRFTDLRPGTYALSVEQKEGCTLTYSFGAPLGEIDSDLEPETGRSAEIVLGSGQTLLNVDVGYTEYTK